MHSRFTHALLSFAALLILAGCATPSGEHKVWRDAGYTGGPLKKVFVIGLSSTSPSDHRGFEELAERLNLLGANIETFRDI